MAAFGAAFVKTRAKLGNPVGDADHRALRLDDLGRGDLDGQHLAELHQRLAQVVGAVEHVIHVLEDGAALFLDQRFEQLFLVGEVDIDRALGDAGFARDVVHRGGFEALVDEDTAGAFDDLAALDRILPGRRAAATQAVQHVACIRSLCSASGQVSAIGSHLENNSNQSVRLPLIWSSFHAMSTARSNRTVQY